ncbi:ATP-binding protein [Gulosibacter sp. GYB002]|uniref:ATP-binding protein n=1 Tax=Gulosibacter sp. GYB002 TaxID=2994391 RepID=UPI002F96131E
MHKASYNQQRRSTRWIPLSTLSRRVRGFAICVDEIQDIDDELAEDLIEAQHTAGQQGLPFFLLGAGLPGTPARLAGSHSYAERLFNYREVGPLNTAGVDAALNEPAARQNASFSFEAVQAIADASAGYPYFVQEFGQAAWNLADGPQITEEEAQAAVQRGFDALDSAFFASRWSKATDRERDYLGAMAVNDGAPARTREVAERLATTVQSLSPQRQSLIDKGIIWSPERGKIAFTVPGMAEFIDRLSS